MPSVGSDVNKELTLMEAEAPPPASKEKSLPPRQPTSLQGLLRFAMEATKAEDAPHETHLPPIDEERKKFLENALKSMTVDVIDVLQKQIARLKTVDKITADDDAIDYLDAANVIFDYIDNIDVANDFHKIGGFMVIRPCLNSPNSKIRAVGCELVALLTQNNPYCQKIILENDFLPQLIDILDKDTDMQVLLKAVYAIGGIVRENTDGFNQLISYNGLPVLIKSLEMRHEKLTIKVCFLLSSLSKCHSDVRSRLIFLNILPALIVLANDELNTSHEFVFSLLVTLLEDNPSAVADLKDPRFNFNDVLLKVKAAAQNKPEFTEVDQFCRILIHLVR